MQLSPLQSRLVASLAATCCILALYFLLLSPRGALATELPLESFSSSWPDLALSERDDTELQSSSYEPIFNYFGRSILGRAGDTVPLENDKPLAYNIQPGGTPVCYIIRKGSLSAGASQRKQERRADSGNGENGGQNTTIYISANTCLQPSLKPGSKTSKPPQMILFLSNSTEAACPQVSSSPNGDQAKGFSSHPFEEGAVTVNINATNDVYIGIYAPKISDAFDGSYDYQLAASSTEYFHQYQSNKTNGAELLWMDSDSTAALLETQSLTNEASEARHIWSEDPPYQLYLSEKGWPTLDGLQHSACGMEKNALIGANNQGSAKNNSMIKTTMTVRGPGGMPKQQFYVVGLNATTFYAGVLVRPANVTVNSKRQENGSLNSKKPGSIVFQATEFTTNAAPNCKVVTDLEFCDEIRYAIPGNDGKFNNTELAKVYDQQAKTMYDNFLKVMQQIQCEADRTSKYSLARTCKDCERAYKRWLCTVSFPRCEDFHSGSQFSVIRNVNQAFPNGTTLPDEIRRDLAKVPAQNASRNSFIDANIQPGPYREIMPCEDICYQVVQSCPSKIGFKCPQPGMYGFDVTYGRRDPDPRVVSCNFPGEARTRFSAGVSRIPNLALVAVTVTFLILLAVLR
ncbi:stretch-activated cation channel mid1 [Conoideocrella luteorostrata]|uniref:Stretch-activated cation channel mid1 n=1 Tax=Conoideocrella luteorostrata TaxID=1105319 RepID=A0AAJ0CDG0_9HYPO|nr:stretch-activated cation channel mid1 [Conoideocrella luteorostrata]